MFARTERLILRPYWPEDAAALANALAHPDISRNMVSVPEGFDEGEAMKSIDRPRDPNLPDFLAFLRTRGQPRLVGAAGISRLADGKLELGYWIERSHWGLGFATEATRAVMRIARATGLGGVRAGHFFDNPSSARVLRKIGFRPTGGVEPRHSRGRETDVPMIIFEYDGYVMEREEPAREIYGDKLFAWG